MVGQVEEDSPFAGEPFLLLYFRSPFLASRKVLEGVVDGLREERSERLGLVAAVEQIAVELAKLGLGDALARTEGVGTENLAHDEPSEHSRRMARMGRKVEVEGKRLRVASRGLFRSLIRQSQSEDP